MKKVIVLASLALLLGGALLLQTGCPQPVGEAPRQLSGWQIQLNVQAPVSATGIEVNEYEVTGLLIELHDPQGELLRTIEWDAAEGPRSYTIAVQQRGQYEISVTHYGEKDSTPVEASESATFNIQAMRITVIDIVPGAIGVIQVDPGESEPQEFDLTGYWDVYMVVDEEQMGPDVIYILQTNSSLDTSHGGTGTIVGMDITVEFWMDDEEEDDPNAGFLLVGSGTVSPSGDEITIWFADSPFGPFALYLLRTTMTFGRLDLEGPFGDPPLFLGTDYAVGQRGDPDEDHTYFVVTYVDHELVVHLWVTFEGDVIVGEDLSISEQVWISLSWRHDDGLDLELPSEGPGSLILTRYDEEGVAGSFSANLEEGGIITGSFDVSFELHPFF